MRVVIAEDSVLLREGLTRLLAEAGHDVVAAAGQAEDFLREVGRHQPDVVVVDVRMPPTFTDEGLRAALVVRGRWPDVGVLVLSQYVEERYATELLSEPRKREWSGPGRWWGKVGQAIVFRGLPSPSIVLVGGRRFRRPSLLPRAAKYYWVIKLIEVSWRGLSVCRAGTRAGAWRARQDKGREESRPGRQKCLRHGAASSL